MITSYRFLTLILLSLFALTTGCGDDKKTTDNHNHDGGDDQDAETHNLMCFGDNTVPCSMCLAEECCTSFGPCNGDTDCYNGYSCLLRCTKPLAECLMDCNVTGNATYEAMAVCGTDKCGTTSCQQQ